MQNHCSKKHLYTNTKYTKVDVFRYEYTKINALKYKVQYSIFQICILYFEIHIHPKSGLVL